MPNVLVLIVCSKCRAFDRVTRIRGGLSAMGSVNKKGLLEDLAEITEHEKVCERESEAAWKEQYPGRPWPGM